MYSRLMQVLLVLLLGISTHALAGGRLLATGGVTQIEGAAGGGIVPWALIAGYGTRDEVGASAFYTHLDISDFKLQSTGAAMGFYDQVEVSLARQRLGLGTTVPGQYIEQDIVGLKLKISGDAVFDQDRWQPQLALGVQYKRNRDFNQVPKQLGAKDDSGIDIYLAATKLYVAGFMGRNVLLNATLRGTRANQMGLLGFGGDLSNQYKAQFEGSAAIFLNDAIAIGTEYRSKPNNLSVYREDDYQNVFAAWMPNKKVAFTLAYAWLGTIANQSDQKAIYGSVQLSH